MPTALDSYLRLLLDAERGAIQRGQVDWFLLAEGFNESEIMVVQTDARSPPLHQV